MGMIVEASEDDPDRPEKILVVRYQDGASEVVGEIFLLPQYAARLSDLVFEASGGHLILQEDKE